MSRSSGAGGQSSGVRPSRVDPRSRHARAGASARAARLETLAGHVGAAAACLGPGGRSDRFGDLDGAAARLRLVEILLEQLAGDPDITADAARQLRSLRDSVSGHLSAAESLRLLDLDTNAALVLSRAVESVRGPMALCGDPPYLMAFYDAG